MKLSWNRVPKCVMHAVSSERGYSQSDVIVLFVGPPTYCGVSTAITSTFFTWEQSFARHRAGRASTAARSATDSGGSTRSIPAVEYTFILRTNKRRVGERTASQRNASDGTTQRTFEPLRSDVEPPCSRREGEISSTASPRVHGQKLASSPV